MEEINSAWTEMKAMVLKILLPAMVGVSIKIAIQSRDKKVTIMQIIISFISGIGFAYLFSGLIMENCADSWVPIWIAVTAISGEKIGQWFVEKFNVEEILLILIDKIRK